MLTPRLVFYFYVYLCRHKKVFTMDIDGLVYERFKEGDIGAFYQRAYPSLLSVATKMLPAGHAYLAEDLVQESVFSAYKMRHSFVSPANLKAYLYSCLHNEAVSMMRRSVRRQRYEKLMPPLPPHISAEGEMMIQETLDLLYDAINALPGEYQQIFELSFVQGLSNGEIASLLNLSVSGTKKRKARFLELMRAKLSGRDDVLLWLLLLHIGHAMMQS